MEAAYILPIVVAILVGGILLLCFWYTRLRMRWHEKGILDITYDGMDSEQNPEQKTVFDYMREEKEYDRRMKEQK